MSVGLRRVAGAAVVVSIGMILCLTIIISGYVRRTGLKNLSGDWLILLLPVLPPLFTVVSWAGGRWVSGSCALVRGFLLGVAVASSAYLLLPAAYLAWQYRLVSTDGTAYWGLLAIPAFWLWLPAALLAGLAGSIVSVARTAHRGVRSP